MLNLKNKRTYNEVISASSNIAKNHNILLEYFNDNNSLLIEGDNFSAMSILIENGYLGKIDLVYIDPPFNSNQDFFVSEDRANAISKTKTGKLAYSDKFDFNDYLSFIRERIILIHRLLSDNGSLYLHIDVKMGHYIKIILDEIFGMDNFKNDITRIKSNPKNFDRKAYGNEKDMILFYVKNCKNSIWNNIKKSLNEEESKLRFSKKDDYGYYTTIPLHAPGTTANGDTGKEWRGMLPPEGRHWRTNPKEFDLLDSEGKIEWSSNRNPRIKKYLCDHKGKKLQDVWTFKDPQNPIYPTQKNLKMLDLIINQSSKNDSIVLDCFAGGGTTLLAAEKNKRRWIGIDNSSISIKTIKSLFDDSTLYKYIKLL